MSDAQNVHPAIPQVSKIVSDMAGIQLGPKQAAMVENRLRSRMSKLGLETFEEYLSYLESHTEEESQALLSLLTTHHTFFFREFGQFEYLLNRGLTKLCDAALARPDKTIRIWSAACSRGQEVYSLAMFFNFHLSQIDPRLKFEIWGTDVDPESVAFAKNGVYRTAELRQSPAMYLENNWTRGQGEVREFSKARAPIRTPCHFTTVNLLDPGGFLRDKQFDLIFCRNVFIYFDLKQVESIANVFARHLTSDGFVFLGVSESLNGTKATLESVGPSVYQPKGAARKAPAPASVPTLVPAAPARTPEILCVDDSGTIHALLGKILTQENGFKIGAKAMNGRQAIELLKTRDFDAITLDLHMPELDGLGFLKEYKGTAPVVILSSVNRDDQSLAQKTLSLGARDYVEKPSLENLAQAGNEIRAKLNMAIRRPSVPKTTSAPTAPPVAATTAALSAKPAPTTAAKPFTSNTAAKPFTSSTTAAKPASAFTAPARPATLAKAPAKPAAPSTAASAPATTTAAGKKIKVLIVDDSQTIRVLLTNLLAQDPDFEVVAAAERPSQVEALIAQHRPDVMTLDIQMPEMDGVQLLQQIFPKYRIPTVMISSLGRDEGPAVLNALASGAVDYIQKPSREDLRLSSDLIRGRIKTAARANLSHRSRVRKSVIRNKFEGENVILIGSSTGGTEALRVVLESLPASIPPVLVVQHIPPVFSAALAQRLDALVPFTVVEASDGMEIKKDTVYIAPGGRQMGVRAVGPKRIIQITDDGPVNRHKPSVDYLFRIAREQNLMGVAAVLTGMGADGAAELKKLRDFGYRTIAQDEKTSVVYGMPKEAARLGGAELIQPIEDIGEQLMKLSASFDKKRSA